MVALASVILWTVVLAVSPAVALARATDTTTNDLQAAKRSANPDAARNVVVVVEAGDCLWSISEELLGPRATPLRVERLVERTYALNRETIGENPHLLLPGHLTEARKAQARQRKLRPLVRPNRWTSRRRFALPLSPLPDR